MKEKILHFFTGSTGAVLGIDIGSGTVKIAELAKKGGKHVLKSAGMVDLPDSIAEKGSIDGSVLTESICQAVAASGASSHDAIVAIGSQAVFVRELSFPPMTANELKEAIKWDVEKYVPYPPNSYYYDFSIISSEKEGSELKVLLVAAPHEKVDSLTKAVEDAGLKLIAIDIEPLAIFRTLNGVEHAMIVDMGAAFTQITLFQNGSPVLTRDIDIGGQRFTEEIMQTLDLVFPEAERLKQRQDGLLKEPGREEEASPLQQQLEMLISELAREIRRTAEYYQMQHQGVVFEHMVITGGGAKLDNLIDYFKGHFEDMKVSVHDPLQLLEINPSLDPEYVKNLSAQMSIAVGLALYGGSL